ncbi:MAG: peptidylprolyl isomerase [Candidatus Diapherotrites archaeon]
MQKGDIVILEFTGREKGGNVFDTTDEKTAIESGMKKENALFQPMTVVVGQGMLLKGIEEALQEMKEGESKKVLMLPEKAFGERKEELVSLIPLNEFKKQNLNPFPGLIVEADGRKGKVQSVSGGRVRVDFNSEMAGKTIEYELKVIKQLKTQSEQVQALAEKYFPLKKPTIVKSGFAQGIATIEIPHLHANEVQALKDLCARDLLEFVKECNKVVFQESFEKGASHVHTAPFP